MSNPSRLSSHLLTCSLPEHRFPFPLSGSNAATSCLQGPFFSYFPLMPHSTLSAVTPPVCMSKESSTKPAPSGIDFRFTRDYVLRFHRATFVSPRFSASYSKVRLAELSK